MSSSGAGRGLKGTAVEKATARLQMLNKGHANEKKNNCTFTGQCCLYANRRKVVPK